MSRLNVGILGCGAIAATMANTVRKTKGFCMYAAASRNLDKATGFAKRNGVRKAYGSYEELLQDKKVDLVYIATPHSEHFEHAKLCISYGKPCLVEKAFTVNEAQAREVFRLAKEKNVFITEAIWTRYMPFVRTMKEVLASGVIGKPVCLSANLGYAIKGKERMVEPALAGGSLLDLGVYPLNFASMMFGDDLLRVEASCTYTSKHLDEQDNLTLIYKDGRMAALTATMLGTTDRKGTIVGTEGYLVIDNINNFERMTVYDGKYKKIASYKRPRQITGYEYELQACRMALENGWLECPEMTHDETIRMMRICDVIRRQIGVIYPFENGSVPDPVKVEEGATSQVEEVIEISPELQIAPQEDAALFMEGPVADAEDAQVIAAARNDENVYTSSEAAKADGSMIADESNSAAAESAGSEQTGPDMTEEAFAASEKTGESETPTEVLSEAPTETPAEAPAEAPTEAPTETLAEAPAAAD